eukprot:9322318-Pyramimonas_sp.AAC.1
MSSSSHFAGYHGYGDGCEDLGQFATKPIGFSRKVIVYFARGPWGRGDHDRGHQVHGDGEVLLVAGGLPDDVALEEDGAIAIYANYCQARQHLRERKLGRGFSYQQAAKESPEAPERENVDGDRS